MKHILTLIITLTLNSLFAQTKIDSSNYFDKYSRGENLQGSTLRTMWLVETEVAQVAHEELAKAGYEWLNDFQIVRLDSVEYVLALCFSEKSRVGFLFESSHRMHPDKKIRTIISDYKAKTGNDYSEKIAGMDGKSNFVKIKTLPKDLVILKSECYWYQQTDNPEDNKKLVTKEDILYVLRQDIRQVISSFPRPTK